jgi:hypothetical protein
LLGLAAAVLIAGFGHTEHARDHGWGRPVPLLARIQASSRAEGA